MKINNGIGYCMTFYLSSDKEIKANFVIIIIIFMKLKIINFIKMKYLNIIIQK